MLRKSKLPRRRGSRHPLLARRGRRSVSETGGDELRGVRTGATDRACKSLRLFQSSSALLPNDWSVRAFREARVRHYRDRPLRLRAEMLRHWMFAAVDVAVGPTLTAVSGWQRPSLASRLRQRLIRRQPQEGVASRPDEGDEVTAPAAPLGKHGEGTPLVSVVLATFNRVSLLEDTLRMVLAQTLDDFELIVCDDGSADGTPVVMAEWAGETHGSCTCANPETSGWPGTCVAESPWRRRNWLLSFMTATSTIRACSNDGWPRFASARMRRSSSTPTTSWARTAGSSDVSRASRFLRAGTSPSRTPLLPALAFRRPSGGP